jgi:RimJ/RimL family protein N-acetyltransferase
MVPELLGDRIRLRGHRVEDFADSLGMWGDPAVTRFIGGRPFTGEEVWSRLLRYFGLWPALGYGYWVIEERASGRFAGEIGLAEFRREVTPPLDSPEAGWALAPWASGRGYATEALAAVLRWADATPATRRTLCMISDGNAASLRVAAKAGYRRLGPAEYRGAATTLYVRDAA